jgi:hypothetical protein
MRLAFVALTAALLLTCTTSVQAQDPAGTAENSSAAAAEPAPAKSQVTTQPGISPELREKLLRDLLNAIAPRRPAAAAPAPAQTSDPPIVITQPAATPGIVTASPVPPRPRPATGAALTPAVTSPAPRPVATTVPRPRPIAEPTRPVQARPAPQAAPVAPIKPAPVEPVPTIEPPVAAAPLPVADELAAPIPQQSRAAFGAGIWLPLGLLAAAAAIAAATVMRVRRARRIERTRAALALKPRIDMAAGASSTPGLSLASPPLAIRARLVVSD